MQWYENQLLWTIIGVIASLAVLGLMMYYRNQDVRGYKKNLYIEHIKNLINHLHSQATKNGYDKIGNGYYGLIVDSIYKTQILDHLKISEKDGLTDAYSMFNKITEKRKKRNEIISKKELNEEEKNEQLGQSFELKTIQEEFDRKIDALYEKVNHDSKPILGFCRDCLDMITTNRLTRWFKKRQLS